MMAPNQAFCLQCKTKVPIQSKPIFKGFEKIGEERVCIFCNTAVQDFKASKEKKAQNDLFSDWKPSSKPIDPFGDGGFVPEKPANPFGDGAFFSKNKPDASFYQPGEVLPICKNCKHYVVHPYSQQCMLHQRPVTATDSCQDFATMDLHSRG